MHSRSFLPVLLAVLSLTCSQVEAAPAKRGDGQTITLSLKRIGGNNGTVHPLIYHRQLANRAARRAAWLTGGEAPTREEMESSMQETIEALARLDGLQKRDDELAAELPVLLGMTLIGTPAGDMVDEDFDQSEEAVAKNDLGTRQLQTRPSLPRTSGPGGGKFGNKPPKPTGNRHTGILGTSPSQNRGPTTPPPVTPPPKRLGMSLKKANAAFSGGTIVPAIPPILYQSAGLDIEGNELAYIATVQISGSRTRLLVDTGSDTTWVTKLTNNPPPSGPTFSVSYLTGGSVHGVLVNEPLNVAGLSLPEFLIGRATYTQGFAPNFHESFDGIMGLSPRAPEGKPTLIEALANARLVHRKLTAFKLAHLDDPTNDGEITFGDVDYSKFDPNTVVSLSNMNKPTSQRALWEVPVDGFWVGRARFNPRTAIIDTGSTFILAPMGIAMAIHGQIAYSYSSNGLFYVPCTTAPQITIVLNGFKFPIPPTDLAHAPILPHQPAGYCQSGIQGTTSNQWILGDVFLKNVYFWTDSDFNSVGFARLTTPLTSQLSVINTPVSPAM